MRLSLGRGMPSGAKLLPPTGQRVRLPSNSKAKFMPRSLYTPGTRSTCALRRSLPLRRIGLGAPTGRAGSSAAHLQGSRASCECHTGGQSMELPVQAAQPDSTVRAASGERHPRPEDWQVAVVGMGCRLQHLLTVGKSSDTVRSGIPS